MHHPSTTSRRAAAALLTAICLLLAACDPTPDKDPFYTPPDPLEAGADGDVLRSRSSIFTLDPLLRSPVDGVSSWQILYRTRNATGESVAVSGTVLVPTSTWLGLGPRPIVSYAVGTRGVGDACAPSYSLAHGTDYEGLSIWSTLQLGYAVVVSDYEGLGTPGDHTYMVGQSQGRAVLDAVRAAQRLPEAGLAANAPVGIMGYSQGGSSAGWAAQLAPTYAPELNIKGVAAGGVPADLAEVANFLDGSAFVAFALLAAMGLDAAYDDLDLDSYLNARGQDLLAKNSSVCIVSVDGFATFLDTAFSSVDDYVTTNPLATPVWQNRLGQQHLGATKPPMPVYQYHAEFDEIVPLEPAQELRDDWCAAGANVTWKTEPLTEHLSGLVTGYTGALTWMTARFVGVPTSGNCS